MQKQHRWRISASSTSLSSFNACPSFSPFKISAETVPLAKFRMGDLNSFRNEAFKGIQVCALLLLLPVLLLFISVLVFVFSVPFGFLFAVYSAINELLSILLDKDNPRKEYTVLDSDNAQQDENVGPSIRMTSPFLSWGSSEELVNLEQIFTPEEPEKEEANIEELQGQFSQIEPGEFVKETMEMFEAVRDEGKVGIEYIQESMEEATSILPAVSASWVQGTVLDLERVKLLAVDDKIDDVSRLQTINEQLENDKPKKKKDGLASLEVGIEHTMNTTMKVIPQNFEKMNTVEDVWNATYKSMYHE